MSDAQAASTHAPQGATLRWSVYALLIALALGQAAGKILAVNSVDLARLEKSRVQKALSTKRDQLVERGFEGQALEKRLDEMRSDIEQRLRLQRPFLSANDRSRWMAIRALVEHGDFEIERYFEEPTWDTIDMVQHRGGDGALHLYSSKPPLLMTLIAVPYWAIHQTTGMTLGSHPYLVGRTLLLLINLGALFALLLSGALLIERLGSDDFGRLFAMLTLSQATLLSAFTPVLSNHLVAAAATALAVVGWGSLTAAKERRIAGSFATGLAAAFAASCELPALSMTGLVFLALLWRRPFETLCGYLPAALLIGAAFFATNHWAHGTIYPPYAFRSESEPAENWYDFEYTVGGKSRESYWRRPSGIDRGEASQSTYAFHALVGHHGVFSLTPVWLLSLYGGVILVGRSGERRALAVGTLIATAACLVFYLGMRPQVDRNYGGMTSGFRWLFWMAPLWAALLPAAVEKLARWRFGLALCLGLLLVSALSASYPTWNPWSHPWLYHWLEHLGYEFL